MPEQERKPIKPGVCIPWEERVKEYEKILGDKKVLQKTWEELDTLAYLYLWFCVISS